MVPLVASSVVLLVLLSVAPLVAPLLVLFVIPSIAPVMKPLLVTLTAGRARWPQQKER